MLYKLRNLKKVHGHRCVLDIDRLDIEPRKVYTLTGPNGAGKTTLLNILSFLDFPTSGSVEYNSSAVLFNEKAARQYRREVVLVDQYPLLFTGPVWKSIDFGLKIRKIPRKDRLKKIEEVLEMVGMSEFHGAEGHKLSGGETKRVALARALAVAPRVLLCDEPTANVDNENQEIILRILERCNRQDNMSLIFATHYLSQAQRLADQTIVLENGRLAIHHQDNNFTARCLAVKEDSKSQTTWDFGNGFTLTVEGVSSHSVGADARVYLDPLQISLYSHDSIEKTKNNCWDGIVLKLEQLNGLVKVEIDTGLKLEVKTSIDVIRNENIRIGDRVIAKICPDPATFLVDQS